MAGELIDYAQIIADLEAKKAALDAALSSFRSAMASGALGQAGDVSNGTGSLVVPSMSGGEVPSGAFFAKSIPEAAKLYLAIVKKKQTTREIAEGLKKGGIESTAKKFNVIVHSILDRARKSGNGIVKLDGYWGLAEWYPSGVARAIVAPPPKRSKRKKVARREKPPAIAESGNKAPAPGGGTREKIEQVLKSNVDSEFSPKEMAEKAGISVNVAALLLGKLAHMKVAEKLEAGKYRAARA